MPHFYSSIEEQLIYPHSSPTTSRSSGRSRGHPSPWTTSSPTQDGTSSMDRRDSTSRPTPPATRRSTSWLDEVGSDPSARRSSQKDMRKPEAIAANHKDQRGSPSSLRATAPTFSLFQRPETYNAVIDEDEELESSMGSLHIGKGSSIWSPQDVRSDSPMGLTRGGLHDVDSRYQSRSFYKESHQELRPPSARIERASSDHFGPVDVAPLGRTLTQPSIQRQPDHGHQKPRAISFPQDVLAKLGGFKPTYTMDDFADQGVANSLHNENSCFVVVEFKLFRAEVYRMDLNWAVSEGVSLVIVEADRGVDLGKVYRLTRNLDEARNIKKQLYRRHWESLLQYNEKAKWVLAQEQAFDAYYNHIQSSAHATGVTGSMAPKHVKSVPGPEELLRLQTKEHMEERARRDTQRKAESLGLNMEVLAAEFQFDMQKLTLYYYSEQYIPYNSLQNEVYKVYKCRLWFSALNPVTFYPPGKGGEQSNFVAPPRRSGDWAAPIPTAGPSTVQRSQYEAAAHRYFSSNAGNSTDDSARNAIRATLTPRNPWNTSPAQKDAFSPQIDSRPGIGRF